ncbi:MAG TPA: hypothetical protein VIH45_04220 [Desulfuromonadaceae bacterium]
MKKPARNITALVLAGMYLAIVMGPLAPLAMHSKVVAHAVTGECSGDCDICGCSPERRANHTCCCYLKKQREAHAHDECDTRVPDCCKQKRTPKKVTTLSCNCPCNSGKQLAFSGAISTEWLPNQCATHISPTWESSQHHTLHRPLTSRYGEPPDPPPKLSRIS